MLRWVHTFCVNKRCDRVGDCEYDADDANETDWVFTGRINDRNAEALLVSGNGVINFGFDVTKDANGGVIGYQTYTPGALDIVGAGTAYPNRNIQMVLIFCLIKRQIMSRWSKI